MGIRLGLVVFFIVFRKYLVVYRKVVVIVELFSSFMWFVFWDLVLFQCLVF